MASAQTSSSRSLRAFRVTTSTSRPRSSLKVLDQGTVIKKRGTGLEADQKIETTVWAGLSPGN